jgi:drug/metabolite transporter (DMT)-like permease
MKISQSNCHLKKSTLCRHFKNMKSGNDLTSWTLFISLCLIWGSSFMLMKEGMRHLTSVQVASLRIFSSGVVMIPWAFRAFNKMRLRMIWPVFVSGLLGSLFPAYFYCMAQEQVESSLAGSLNALTPIFVIILGSLFFRARIGLRHAAGVLISFSGSVLLSALQPGFGMSSHGFSIMLILLATMAYGLNVNVVNRFLTGVSSIDIAAVALFLIAIPAGAILWQSGFRLEGLEDPGIRIATVYGLLLGVLSTALASVLFYILIKRAGIVFASMVTYGIPVIANIWGLFYGEHVGLPQLLCLALILAGVFIATRVPGDREKGRS